MARWINVEREICDGIGVLCEPYIQCPFCLKDFPTKNVIDEKLPPFHFCPNCGQPLKPATNKKPKILTDWIDNP